MRLGFVLAILFIGFASISTVNGAPVTRESATVLLITSKSLAPAWKPFANWKTSIGKPTKIVTVEAVAKDYEGKDIQAKIRSCCQTHISKHGTRWIILGGDSEPGGKGLVPDRDTLHVQPLRYKDIPSDVYYLSTTDWDANQDGVYGDWRNDRKNISYGPENACIGRIPVRTAANVKAYTAKVIAYEKAYPAKSFAKQMVYTCPVGGAYPKLGTSRKVLSECWKGAELHQFFANATPWDGARKGDFDLSAVNFVNMINKNQAGKMHIHGHGLLQCWILERHQKLTPRHVQQMKNTGAYPAITTVSCFTGHFESKKDPSITEAMLRQPEGGAIMVIAPAREGVPVFHNPRVDFRLMVQQGKMDGTTETLTKFWTYAMSKRLTAGEAFAAAKREMAQHAAKTAGYHYVLCELNLLGDPTLDLRAEDPRTPEVKLPTKLKTGKQKLVIKTNSPGSTICISKGNEVYVVATADKNGIAEVSIAPKTAGDLSVTVSGPCLNVRAKTVPVR